VSLGVTDCESLLASGDPGFAWEPPADEWDAIVLNYTLGTTGDPKGVVYGHRGAYLNAIANLLTWGVPSRAPGRGHVRRSAQRDPQRNLQFGLRFSF
jgi:fatty-acyl-CoA synthase